MTWACAGWQGEIGALVVGALDRDAAAAVTRHVAVCDGCRAEYDDLIPLRGWLSRLTGLLAPGWDRAAEEPW